MTSLEIVGKKRSTAVPADTRLPRVGHDLRTFQMRTPTGLNSESGSPMPAVKVRASTILGEFGEAQSELGGKGRGTHGRKSRNG
jgi:hypothetical protein